MKNDPNVWAWPIRPWLIDDEKELLLLLLLLFWHQLHIRYLQTERHRVIYNEMKTSSVKSRSMLTVLPRLHDTTGSHTGLTTVLTTGCIV